MDLQHDRSVWVAFIVLLALIRTFSMQAESLASPSFKAAPYPLYTVGGGNCVWLVWQKARQEWGIVLPIAGHAHHWRALNGIRMQQQGRLYQLSLTHIPRKNSILILKPAKTGPSSPALTGHYGHAAWVEEVGPGSITVMESSIFPGADGPRWQGCWYRRRVYDSDRLPEAQFLYAVRLPASAPSGDPLPASGIQVPFLRGLEVSLQEARQLCEEMWRYTLLSSRLLIQAVAFPAALSVPESSPAAAEQSRSADQPLIRRLKE